MYRTGRYRAVLPKGDRRRSIEQKLRREEEEEKKKRKRRKKKKRKRKGTSSRPRPRAVATRGSPASLLKRLVNGRFTLGSTAIVILFQIVTNFGLFHSQIFIHRGDRGKEEALAMSLRLLLIRTERRKRGDVWINLGPLLYHFADSYGPEDVCEMSIELSLEDVKKIAFHYGFVMEKERVIETTYTANPRSMMQ
ncbi:hypothetical protein BHM03_00013929, partial [Ensete ventricosum]